MTRSGSVFLTNRLLYLTYCLNPNTHCCFLESAAGALQVRFPAGRTMRRWERETQLKAILVLFCLLLHKVQIPFASPLDWPKLTPQFPPNPYHFKTFTFETWNRGSRSFIYQPVLNAFESPSIEHAHPILSLLWPWLSSRPSIHHPQQYQLAITRPES